MGDNDVQKLADEALQNLADYEPTTAGKRLVEVLLDPANRHKTVTDVCQLAEVSRDTYYRLMNDPGFDAWYRAETQKAVGRYRGQLISAYVKEALGGSAQHGNVLLEMDGIYQPKKRTELTGKDGGPVAWEGIRPRDEVEQRLREMGLLPQDEEKGED